MDGAVFLPGPVAGPAGPLRWITRDPDAGRCSICEPRLTNSLSALLPADSGPSWGEKIVGNLDIALKNAMNIDGAIGAALVDYTSGMTLGVAGGTGEIDLTVAAAGNTDVVRAKLRTIEMLKLDDEIEDILITLGSQYHLIRPLSNRTGKGLFLYLMVSKSRANLAMARHQLRTIEESLEL